MGARIPAPNRRANAIQSAEQSVFNALMILRFVRDDPMTSGPQKDQTSARAQQKPRTVAASFIIVTPRRQ